MNKGKIKCEWIYSYVVWNQYNWLTIKSEWTYGDFVWNQLTPNTIDEGTIKQ